ncbi:MAG TPA: DUF4861 family protein, partial [Chthoniobacteraceae bacterium]|nr:DUF4861 family protein [Chthoniobacteraceae bacterium]
MKNICLSLTLICASSLYAATEAPVNPGIPVDIPVNFTLPARPFMLLSAEERAAAQKKVANEPWAKEALAAFLKDADGIVADPLPFPNGEAGWGGGLVSPVTGAKLLFDPKKPHEHWCPAEKAYYRGIKFDQAWNAIAMQRTADEQQKLSTAWLLTGNRKYAEALRKNFLDIAEKYSKYRRHDREMTNFGDRAEPIAGIATSQSIEECDLLSNLAFSYDTLLGSGALSKADRQTIDGKLWKRAQDYLYRIMVLHPSGGNWWMWHACACVVVGVEMGDEKLVSIGLNQPNQGILSMLRGGYVNDDGWTSELSPGYQLYPFKAITRMMLAAQRVGIDIDKLTLFHKMFDLPISICLPNLELPRLNDGGGGTLASQDWANIYELSQHWFNDPKYGELLHDIYAARQEEGGTPLTRANRFALLFGRALPDRGLEHDKSKFLTYSGLSILRTPRSDWNVLLKDDMNREPGTGHHHPDALNLILYANGSEALPGTASCSYGLPLYRQWFSQTIGANTVTLNERSQSMTKLGKEMELGISWNGMGAAQASAASTQIDKRGKQSAAMTALTLRRTVVMTPHAVIDFYRVAPNSVISATNQVDLALHMNGKFAPDAGTQPCKDALAPATGSNGYELIRDVRTVSAPKGLHGTLTQENGATLGIWLSPDPSEKLYLANGPGLPDSLDKPMPMLLRRRTTNATIFGAVAAPSGNAAVSAVSFPLMAGDGKGAAAEVTDADGKDVVLSLPESGSLKACGATLQGTLGCASHLPKGEKLVMLAGTEWKDADMDVKLDQPGDIFVDSAGNETRIHNGGKNPASGVLRMGTVEKQFNLRPGEEASLTQARVTVTNDLNAARPDETIDVRLKSTGPFIVRDAAGKEIVSQMLGNGDVIFQANFAPKEVKEFTVTPGTPAQYPSKVFGRYVPERLDDFAWESDRIAYRMYGPALQKQDGDKTGSGVDVWCKHVRTLVVNRMYNRKSYYSDPKDPRLSYHNDDGYSADNYGTGSSRGCGGSAVWSAGKLWPSRCYASWKLLANGPIRVAFELTYAPWNANGVQVSEVKDISLDAGSNLNRFECHYNAENQPVTAAAGLFIHYPDSIVA